jgi:superfamily II DNA or RNA helicase
VTLSLSLSLFTRPSSFASALDDIFDDEDPDGHRYYQRECDEAIRRAFETDRSTLVVMATGMGKTNVFSAVAKNWPGSVLVLANRNELVEQARKRLEKMTGELVEVEQADWKASPRARLVVGSVQSFHKSRLEKMPKDRFSLVIADECDLFLAPTYRRVLEYFDAKVLGVTATPDRGDEKALGQIFDSVAYVMGIEDGIDAGYLVPIVGRQVVFDEIELDRLDKSSGDLVQGELDEEMVKVVQGVVKETYRLEPDRQGIGFFPGVRSAELASEAFNSVVPGSSIFICATTEEFARKRMIADFRQGRVKYLCNVGIATRGFDCPPASLVIQACPTLSRSKYTQMVGRATRTLPGTVDYIDGTSRAADRRAAVAQSLKPNAVLLDFVGNSTRHSLVTLHDVLGGNYEPAEVELAKKKMKGSDASDPREALRQARAEIARMAQVKAAKVKASVRDFDPFRIFEVDDSDRYVARFGEKPVTEQQKTLLRRFKVTEEEMAGLSKKSAKKLVDTCFDRAKNKLCTLKQLRILKQFGITRTDISFERASQAMTYIIGTDWGRLRPVDPQVLNDLVYSQRQSGEEG